MLKFGFSQVPGNDWAKKYLSSVALGKDVPQSIIITGESGVGKLPLAEQFALALLCENPTSEGACGKCNSCLTYGQGQNRDIAYWYPKGQNTTIDQMRRLKEISVYTPTKGKYKINIIQKGDTLNEEASNSILKIIEEPPAYLINILIYTNPHNILQTIRSRSIAVNMQPVSLELIKNYLSDNYGITGAECESVAGFSMGALGKAVLLAENEKRDVFRQMCFECVQAVVSKPMDLLYLADRLADRDYYFSEKGKESADDIKNSPKDFFPNPVVCQTTQSEAVFIALDMISLIFRDLFAVKCGADSDIINKDKINSLKDMADRLSQEKIQKAINTVWKTKDRLRANINTVTALQAMLCRILMELREK